jgi:hypothetical protein
MDGRGKPSDGAPSRIDVESPKTWPADLSAYLSEHHDLFLDWETGPTNVTAPAYDRAIYGLCAILQQYALMGWHCTRLTAVEIAAIISGGMQPPDSAMLNRRIDQIQEAGLISAAIAKRLKVTNQADDKSRAGMVWFCFFPPRLAGESGIERFFRSWGGEALYNSHERDPLTGGAIRRVGVPCLVEADVPIASFKSPVGLSFKMVRRFLVSWGYQTIEPVDHEDRITRNLQAQNIRRIIRFPEPDFLTLTGCHEWDDPIALP